MLDLRGGERVDVIGTSKGKGFQGVIKRHDFAGGAATHGSMFHRAPGSIGASSFPSRVIKGMRCRRPHGRRPRHDAQPKVVKVDADNNLLLLSRRRARRGAAATWSIRKAVAKKPDPQPQPEKKKGKK